MKQYRLKQWYPSLFDDIEVGTIVDYEDGWIYYTNTRGNKTSIEIDEEELSHKDFWELVEEEPTWTKAHCLSFNDVMMAIGYKASDPNLAIKLEKELEKLAKERIKNGYIL